jgi:hypothetical protein
MTFYDDAVWTVTTPDDSNLLMHVAGLRNDGTTHQVIVANGTGCSPLCEQCWSNLTIAQRLPYYHKMLWDHGGIETNKWPRLKAAVLAGE